MFLLFGTKGYHEVMGVTTLICRFCGSQAAQRVDKFTTKFTLFFVPLFPVSTKYALQCAACAAQSPIDQAGAQQLTSTTYR